MARETAPRKGFKEVSKEEFDSFLKSYPGKLDMVCSLSSLYREFSDKSRYVVEDYLPQISAYNFTVVAYYNESYGGEELEHYIRVNDDDKEALENMSLEKQVEKLKEKINDLKDSLEFRKGDLAYEKKKVKALMDENDKIMRENKRYKKFLLRCQKVCAVRRCEDVLHIGEEADDGVYGD